MDLKRLLHNICNVYKIGLVFQKAVILCQDRRLGLCYFKVTHHEVSHIQHWFEVKPLKGGI